MTNELEYPTGWNKRKISIGVVEIMKHFQGKIENYPEWLTSDLGNLPRYNDKLDSGDIDDGHMVETFFTRREFNSDGMYPVKIIWIIENTEHKWCSLSGDLYWFENCDDAVLFKMTWC